VSHEKWCKHYTGIDKKVCQVGICYDSIRDPSPDTFRYKCYDPDSAVDCVSYELHTAEELAAQEAEWKDRWKYTLLALQQVKPMRKRGRSSVGTIECPKCQGVLDYGISGYNGHTRGKCQTEGCITWIE
jgi:hypothetical protein